MKARLKAMAGPALACLICLVLRGCTAPQTVEDQIQMGMTFADAKRLLGPGVPLAFSLSQMHHSFHIEEDQYIQMSFHYNADPGSDWPGPMETWDERWHLTDWSFWSPRETLESRQ